MPDFRRIVRVEIGQLGLPADRESRIVEELAAHIEEVHAAVLDEGFTGDAALAETWRRIPEWPELRREILDAEPVARLAHPESRPFPGNTKRTLISALRRVAGSGLLPEIRTGLRHLGRSPAYAITAILTLGVCLGGNAAIFTVIDRVLLRPIEAPDPGEIMLVANQFPNTGMGVVGETSAPRNYFDRLEGVTAFSGQALFAPADRVVATAEGSRRVHGMEATPSLFPLLGARAVLGRTFLEEEGEVGREQRVLLSHGLWQEVSGGDAEIVGRDLRLDGRPFTVVGVMAADFSFFDPDTRFWIPLAFNAAERQNPIANNWFHIGRLASGATREQAQAEVDRVNGAFMEEVPALRETLENAGYHTTVEPLGEVMVRGFRRILVLLWGGALVVLLVGTVNMANLTLARVQSGRRELATRLALGAGRGRLAALLLSEGLAVAIAGGALGLALGWAVLRSLGAVRLDRLVLTGEVGLTPAVILVGMTLAVLTGVVVGIAPMRYLGRIDLLSSLQQNNRTGSGGRHSGWARRSLVASQVALTFVLLTGAGLLLATLDNLLSVDPGYTTDNILTAAIGVPEERYPTTADAHGFLDRALAAIGDLPGVGSVAASTLIPLSGRRSVQAAIPEGSPRDPDASILAPTWVGITPGFFDTIGAPLLAGRDLDARDNEGAVGNRRLANGVVIVDETLARTFWPGQDPLGKRMFLPGIRNVLAIGENTRWLTVVGVVPDLLLENLYGRAGTVGTMYTPYAEANANNPARSFGFVVRPSANPSAVARDIRQAVAGVDPELALFDIQTLTQRTSLSVARERMATLVAAAFASIALLLSILGIYGVLSHLVAERRRELGIRIALGSTAAGILRLVLGEGLLLVAAGLLGGFVGRIVLQPALASQIYGVAPDDPAVTLAVAAILVVASLLACLFPALRATRVDPLRVLNEE